MAEEEELPGNAGDPSAKVPGARDQEQVDARWGSMREEIGRISRQHFQHVYSGGREFVLPSGERLQPVELRAEKREDRWPPVDPEPVDFFLHWPPAPPEYEGKKRPGLLFLHGAGASKDEFPGLGLLAHHAWFLDLLPKELVVLIPQCPSRARRPWVAAGVKATLLYAVEQAIESGVDPDRVYVTGLSMGGIGTWELALDAAEGRAPFAAAVPVCGMVMNTHRLPSLANYPLWVFHGANDQTNPCARDDEAVAAIVAAGANQRADATLRYTRYKWSPGAADYISGTTDPSSDGHGSWEQAYADEELWPWLLRQRRDPERFRQPASLLPDGRRVPGGRHQGEVDERLPGTQEHKTNLIKAQHKHMLSGGKELVVHGREPIPPIRLQGERDDSRKPPLEPEAMDFFIVWPPNPEGAEEKRPALLFLHGAGACQDEGGLIGLADNTFWLPRCPEEMVVIIPHARSRKHHWLMRSVKATLLFAIEKVIQLGVDPDRVYVTGLSMGGTAAWEFALGSVEGVLPFAASVAVTPYVMSIKRAGLLTDFPIWVFYGSNEWDSLVARVDDAVAAALEAGANHGKEANLQCTRYAWSPDTADPGLHYVMNLGHGTYCQAYGEPDLWSWLLRQRRRPLDEVTCSRVSGGNGKHYSSSGTRPQMAVCKA